jgi:anti-sigma B factor antagonist
MSDMNLLVESREAGAWTVVDVRGEIDLYTAPRLKEHFGELFDGGRAQVVVNLEGVEFLDSTGLGVLIGALRRCRERDGVLALAAPRETVQKVLRVTGLDKVFPVHNSVDEATAS